MNTFIEFINSTFNIDNNTSATIVITLTVFLLGFIISWLKNSIKSLLKRNRIKKIFLDLLKEITETASKQSAFFKDFYESLYIENEDKAFRLKRIPINHLENIQKLNINSVYEAFFSGIENIFNKDTKRKAFNKCWLHINSLNYWEYRYPEEIQSFISKFNVYEEKRNDALEKWRVVSQEIFHQATKGEIPKELAEYISRYDKIVYDWQTNGMNTHYYIVQNELIYPLISLNREYKQFHFVLLITNILLEVTNYYEDLVNTINFYREGFKIYYHTYRSSSKVLEKALKILEKKLICT